MMKARTKRFCSSGVSPEEINNNPLLVGLAPKHAGDAFESPDEAFMPGEHTLWI